MINEGGVLCSGIDSNGADGSTSCTLPFSAIVADGNGGLKAMKRGGGLDKPESADEGRDGEVSGDMYGDEGRREGESGPSWLARDEKLGRMGDGEGERVSKRLRGRGGSSSGGGEVIGDTGNGIDVPISPL